MKPDGILYSLPPTWPRKCLHCDGSGHHYDHCPLVARQHREMLDAVARLRGISPERARRVRELLAREAAEAEAER